MESQVINNGKIFFRDTITDEKVIKEIKSDEAMPMPFEGTIKSITINSIDKDSDMAKKLINNLSSNIFVRINYTGDD